MNRRIDFSQLNGFPLTQDTLAFMQQSYREVFAALSGYFGQYTIVAGVADLGANWGDGLVTYNGELLPFVGGLKNTQIIVEETNAAKQFQDGQNRTVWFTRVARCGVAGGIPFTTFVRLPTASQIINDIGARVAKSGDTMSGPLTIPNGTLSGHAVNLSQLNAAISQLINGSPAALDTLIELANALGNDANFATTVTNALAARVLKAGDTMTGLLTLAAGFRTKASGPAYRFEDYDLGAWNMQSTQLRSVPHGLGSDWVKVKKISCRIRNDANNANYINPGNFNSTFNLECNVINATEIVLIRIAGGFFDNASFSSTAHSRGKLYVELEF